MKYSHIDIFDTATIYDTIKLCIAWKKNRRYEILKVVIGCWNGIHTHTHTNTVEIESYTY